jgi:hypothetical protein
MIINGFVLILFARAAYRSVLIVSATFDLAGDMHAICVYKMNIISMTINGEEETYHECDAISG